MAVLPLGYVVIYGLCDSRTGIVKYVGVTSQPSYRFKEHLRGKKESKIKVWIDELKSQKVEPIFIFLDSVHSSLAEETEMKWITHFNKISPLINSKLK